MSWKTVSAIMMSLLVISTLTLAFKIQSVKADDGTIYINADGSISPSTAPVYTTDNITYTLTGNTTAVTDGIVVERDNIVLDGAGFTVQGNGTGTFGQESNGIYLEGVSNVTIRNTTVESFHYGILLDSSSNNSISGNNIVNNLDHSIELDYSSNNSINLTGNYC